MSNIQLNDPQALYRHWEESQWSPFAVDLSIDKEQWPALDPEIREIIYFALSSLMVAEEPITTKFTGLVAAHGSEEEATFLATQQVDEARHMQFYARFRDEVVAEPQPIAAHVERAREQVSDSFRELFDRALVELHDELVTSPGDLAAKVRFITLYHLVLESTLGLTAATGRGISSRGGNIQSAHGLSAGPRLSLDRLYARGFLGFWAPRRRRGTDHRISAHVMKPGRRGRLPP
jgi:ribonucleoside-diphosphate reductase beta chain